MLSTKKLLSVAVVVALASSAVIYGYERGRDDTREPSIYDFLTQEQCEAAGIDTMTAGQQALLVHGILDDYPVSYTAQTAEAYMVDRGYHKVVVAEVVPHQWSSYRHYAIVVDGGRVYCLESPLLVDPLAPGVYWSDYIGMGIFFDIMYPDGDEEMFRVLE